jgi:hypothetical protein
MHVRCYELIIYIFSFFTTPATSFDVFAWSITYLFFLCVNHVCFVFFLHICSIFCLYLISSSVHLILYIYYVLFSTFWIGFGCELLSWRYGLWFVWRAKVVSDRARLTNEPKKRRKFCHRALHGAKSDSKINRNGWYNL